MLDSCFVKLTHRNRQIKYPRFYRGRVLIVGTLALIRCNLGERSVHTRPLDVGLDSCARMRAGPVQRHAIEDRIAKQGLASPITMVLTMCSDVQWPEVFLG